VSGIGANGTWSCIGVVFSFDIELQPLNIEMSKTKQEKICFPLQILNNTKKLQGAVHKKIVEKFVEQNSVIAV
jgi:hypothetical protein